MDLTIFTNTHSSCRDIWPMFFSQLEKHWPDHPRHIIASDRNPYGCLLGEDGDIPGAYVLYDPGAPFSTQYLDGLLAVDTEYVLTLQEDFILYGDVDAESIFHGVQAWLKLSTAKFLRLIWSGMGEAPNHPIISHVHESPYPYSMQATVWKTEALRDLYRDMNAATPWDAEVAGCKKFTGHGLVWCSGNPKRGRYHYDSLCFPYCSTALVRGRWNMAEYAKELTPLLKEYGIDPTTRGTNQILSAEKQAELAKCFPLEGDK